MPKHNPGPYLSDDRNEFGYYEIRWTERGRSKRKSTGESDYRKAQRVFAEFIISLDQAVNAPKSTITCKMVFDAYLADRTDVMAPGSQMITFGHLAAHFGEMTVSEVERDDIRRYTLLRELGAISFTDAEGRIRGGAKAGEATVRRELGMFATAINHCIEKKSFRAADGTSLLTPADRPVIELPPAPPPRDRWLTRQEAAALLAAAREPQLHSGEPADKLPRVYRYIAMMLYTASRKEPVISLTWDRILLEQGLINFQQPGRRLTKKRRGWVPIAAELMPILRRAYAERTTEFFLDKPTQPFHSFRAAVKRAGLADVSPHVCRHSWATWAAQDGVPLFEIAGVLHDSMATVERHYAHHTPQHLRGAVNRPMLVAGTDVQAA